MSNWTEIAKLEDIPKLGSRVLKTDTMNIALFRTATDEVFAIKDECPHKQGPLSQGIVHGTSVTCPSSCRPRTGSIATSVSPTRTTWTE